MFRILSRVFLPPRFDLSITLLKVPELLWLMSVLLVAYLCEFWSGLVIPTADEGQNIVLWPLIILSLYLNGRI